MEREQGRSGSAQALGRLAAALRRRASSAPTEGRRTRAEALRRHVEDYLQPRAADLDAPLLVVIMGSTGSGKSSLLNALVGWGLSPSGVLRPTTRRPVAIAHRDDLAERITGLAERTGIDLRTGDGARSGLVVVDAPDFDSVEAENRVRAMELLELADLVIFVTTASRYADQVPWDVLARARARGVPLLAVVNRLPGDAADAEAVLADYRALLEQERLVDQAATGELELVAVAEGDLDPARDALGVHAITPIRDALDRLVVSHEERREVAQRALAGALRGIPDAVEAIAAEADEEQRAIAALRATADRAYVSARRTLAEELRRGTFMRAEVLRQWQEYIGAGQVARFLAEGIGKVLATIRSVIQPGPPAPATEVREAAFADLTALTVQHADAAAQRTTSAWSGDPYGEAALAADVELWQASPGLPQRLADDLEDWAARIGDQIRELGTRRKGLAQVASLGVNVVGTSAVLAVFVHTGGLTGAEVGITAATAVVNQKLLEALFGEANVAAFVFRAREDLDGLLDRAFADEQARWSDALGDSGDPAVAGELRGAAGEVARLLLAS